MIKKVDKGAKKMITFNQGTTEEPEKTRFHSHIHNDYELFYFLRGDADYIIEGATYRMHRHDLLLIRPRIYHNLLLHSNATYERFVINFSKEDVPEFVHEVLRNEKPVCNIEEHPLPLLMFDEWKTRSKTFSPEELACHVRSTLYTTLLTLKHRTPTESIQPIHRNRALETILQYIDEHPTEQHTAETLSGRFFVSTSWIIHSFRQHLGITLQQYVSKKRALYAQRLLRRGTPATEVAQICGFESYTTFYRQYVRIFGTSPQKEKNAET